MWVTVGGGVAVDVGDGVCVAVGRGGGVGDSVGVAVGGGEGVGDGVLVAVGRGEGVLVTGASAASATVAAGSISGASSPQAASTASAAAVAAMPPTIRNMKDSPCRKCHLPHSTTRTTLILSNQRRGSVYFCGMTAGGGQLSKAVRPIAQREIPAYAGMTRPGGNLAVRIRRLFIETPATRWTERNRRSDPG